MPSSVLPPSLRVLAALADLAREGAVPVSVAGECMAPGMVAGSVVLVRAARVYWPGDVLAFAGVDGRLVLHRLLGYRLYRGRLTLVTRGDGNPGHDFPVAPAAVLGRAVGVVPMGTRLRALMRWWAIPWRRWTRGASPA